MKKAAKVFLVLGMIFNFYFIFPIILGAIALDKINKAQSVDELRTWGILSILFVSVLGGIFTLCIKDNELSPLEITAISETGYDTENDPSQKLLELKSLLDEGIINEETYQEKRKKYLEDL